ncbi:P-loop NTPase [archaeon]|nr:P-loop NTPase [archaeon]
MSPVIAIAGGKGGTGKTTIAVNLADALHRRYRLLLVDADCSNPCTRTFFSAAKALWQKEITLFKPQILEERCHYKACKRCVELCPEHALLAQPNKPPALIEDLCNGCSVCQIVCNYGAITEAQQVVGHLYFSEVDGNLHLLVSELTPGSRKNPVVVHHCMVEAERLSDHYDLTLVDCPAGTGIDLYLILRYATTAILVTEPTLLALSDLKKLSQLLLMAGGKPTILVVNKSGINPNLEKQIVSEIEAHYVVKIPYDHRIFRQVSSGRLLTHLNSKYAQIFDKLAEIVVQLAHLRC